MRRRFGRGRQRDNKSEAKSAPIDARLWLRRIAEAGLVDVPALEPVSIEGVPDSFAALGSGTRGDGSTLRVAFSPRSGSDAVLAAVSFARLHGSGAAGEEIIAISPQWPSVSRRILGTVRSSAAPLRAVGAESLGEQKGTIGPESFEVTYGARPRRAADLIARSSDRDVFLRALTALEGLAAKHAGAVRSAGDTVELVLLARRVAALSVHGGRVQLETYLPDRASQALDVASLSTALDRLEGSMRKRLNDRKIRGSEDELRAGLLPILERAVEARWTASWPLAGSDPEVIDLAAVRGDGTPVLAAARDRLTLPALGAILESTLGTGAALASLFARVEVPVRAAPPELMLAAKQCSQCSIFRTARSMWEPVATARSPSSLARSSPPRRELPASSRPRRPWRGPRGAERDRRGPPGRRSGPPRQRPRRKHPRGSRKSP